MNERTTEPQHEYNTNGGIYFTGEHEPVSTIRWCVAGADNPGDPYQLVGDVLRVDHILPSAIDQLLGEALFGSERWRRLRRKLGTDPAEWLREWTSTWGYTGPEQLADASEARGANPRTVADHRQDGTGSSSPTLAERVRALEEQLYALQKEVHRVS